MGCWSSKPSRRCARCHSKVSSNYHFDNEQCSLCNWKSTEQHRNVVNIYAPDIREERVIVARNSSHGVLPQPRLNAGVERVIVARNSSHGVLPQPRLNAGVGKANVASNHNRRVIPQQRPKTGVNGAQFGEFLCKPCGRSWSSRRCWLNKYQMCKRCKKPVYPFNCRDIHPSDYTSEKDSLKHEMKLCEMCLQLGYNCKSFGKRKI